MRTTTTIYSGLACSLSKSTHLPPPFPSLHTQAPKFLTIQVSRSVLNDTIENLNTYAAPRLATPSELLLTVDEMMAIIDQGELSRTLLLSAAHLKRIEVRTCARAVTHLTAVCCSCSRARNGLLCPVGCVSCVCVCV